MSREDPQLKLRLTEEMKDRISEAARQSGRSVNAEIVARLAFTEQAHPHATLIRALIDMHEKLLTGGAEVVVPDHLQRELHTIAEKRGLPSQRLLINLLIEALNQLDDETDVGREFARRVFDLDHEA